MAHPLARRARRRHRASAKSARRGSRSRRRRSTRCASRLPQAQASRGDRARAAPHRRLRAPCTGMSANADAARRPRRARRRRAQARLAALRAERAELAEMRDDDVINDETMRVDRGAKSTMRNRSLAPAASRSARLMRERRPDRVARRHVRPGPLRAPAARRRRAARARRSPKCAWSRPAIRRIAAAPQPPAADRLAMLRARASREFPGLVVDAREIARGGKSYTVLTLEELRARGAGAAAAAAASAPTRSSGCRRGIAGARSSTLAHVVVVARPGVALDDDLPDDARGRVAERADSRPPRPCFRAPAGAIYEQRRRAAADLGHGDPRALARGADGREAVAVCSRPPFWPILTRNDLYSDHPPQDAT